MKCVVSEPGGKSYEFIFAGETLGQHCLDKVCEKLGIWERTYFGLRYTVNDTNVWLNLRNPVLAQLRPNLPGKPHRLRLEVKFFVAPKELQQEETRRQFYFCLRSQLAEGKFKLEKDVAAKVCALMAQTEYGDSNYPLPMPDFIASWTRQEIMKKISEEKKLLRGMTPKVARLAFLNLLAKAEMYDCEIFKAKALGEKVIVAVGKSDLKVFERKSSENLRQTIPFENITKIKLFEERLILVMKKVVTGRYNFVHFFLQNSEAAKAMHKTVLEHQLFFYSSKVHKSVLNHYLLALPCWAWPAKWLDKLPSGDLFHLDVYHTRRQAYDLHYKKLQDLKRESLSNPWIGQCAKCNKRDCNTVFCPCGHLLFCSRCAKEVSVCPICQSAVAENKKVYFAGDMEGEDYLCQICMTEEVRTVIIPCGHALACEECAMRMDYCPICKTWATFVQRIRVEFDQKHLEVSLKNQENMQVEQSVC